MRPLFFIAFWLGLSVFSAPAAVTSEVIPPAPKRYFNDYASVVSPATAEQLNSELEQFERDTSSQVLVVVYPKMQSPSSIEDYTVRVAQSWKVGQKGTNNGAVLFVFVQDRKMYLQVGYGLEGAIPDATAKQIIDNDIKPRFAAGDFDGGLRTGVQSILAAARGEYKGTGRTAAERGVRGSGPSVFLIFLVIFLILVALASSRRRSRWGGWGGGGWTIGSGGMFGGGGFRSGGSSWGGGGGGFSGGGGSFGGGGAGGSW